MKLKRQDEYGCYLIVVNYSAVLTILLLKGLFQTGSGGVTDANSFVGFSQIYDLLILPV